jgi:hypothetical protein
MLDRARAQLEHGRLVEVAVGEYSLVFRPLTPREAATLTAALERVPELTVQLCADAARACCLSPDEDFEAALDEFPVALTDALAGELLKQAHEVERAIVRAAVARWKRSERDLGAVARNLLAFKAYAGGDADEATFAGALAVAEWFDSAKALAKMFSGLMKALAKRR